MSREWKVLKLRFLKEYEELVISLISDTKTNGILEIERDRFKIYKVFFDINSELSTLKKGLKALNIDLIGEDIIEEEDWNLKWKENFKGVKIRDFFVRPPWIKKLDGYIDVIVEPGGAFGTGIHETTQLCIEAIPNFLKGENISILDCGCGSGILLIASIKYLERKNMSLKNFVGIDIDPLSIKESRKNFALNDIPFKNKNFVISDLRDFNFSEKFDIIFANMLYNEIEMNINQFANLVLDNGILLFSGILQEEKDDFVSLLNSSGFSMDCIFQKNKWMLFVARKKGCADVKKN